MSAFSSATLLSSRLPGAYGDDMRFWIPSGLPDHSFRNLLELEIRLGSSRRRGLNLSKAGTARDSVTAILVLVSSQSINGVELRGFSRWKIAKHDPCQKSTGEGDDDRYNRGASSTDDVKDFKRAVALQASPDQVVRFRRLTESTQIARKSAQDLLKFSENASKTDLFRSTDHLTSALEQAQTDNQNFFAELFGRAKIGATEDHQEAGQG